MASRDASSLGGPPDDLSRREGHADDLSPLAQEIVLITGADGMLGRAFQEALTARQPPSGATSTSAGRVVALDRQHLDVTDRAAVLACASLRPTLILHCAGNAAADVCEQDPVAAHASHYGGTAHVVALAQEVGARVFYPQSVFIFDGRELPVTEETVPAPMLAYGRSKLEAERHLLASVPGSLSVRMAGFFGGDEKDKNFVGWFTRNLASLIDAGETSYSVGDRVWQPTYTLDLARNTLLLLARGCRGIYHMGARGDAPGTLGEATFFEVASACVDRLGLGARLTITPRHDTEADRAGEAPRPRRMFTAMARLDREGLNRQRPWRAALAEYLSRPHFAPLRARAAARTVPRAI